MKRIFLLIIILFSFVACDDLADEGDESLDDPPTVTIRDREDETAVSGDTWLIMLYLAADDEVLERDIFLDLNEAELVGSSDEVHIVAQLDRYDGAFDGDGDWTDTRRYYLTEDSQFEEINSEEVDNIGEAAMSDAETLIDFVVWAAETYPADKHALIMSDHGAGWPGGWSDPEPGGRGDHDIALAEYGDELFLMELDGALAEIIEQTDIGQLDLIGFDACLMAHIEVFTAVSPYARYAVASQELEPAIGWAYAAFLRELVDTPTMDGRDLAQSIVETYIAEDERLLNDEARAVYIEDAYGWLSFLFEEDTAEMLANSMLSEGTLSAVDLSALPDLLVALNELTVVMTDVKQKDIATARTYAQSFQPVFGEEASSYIDVGSFASIVAEESGDSDVEQASEAIHEALRDVVFAEVHGTQRGGATGVSIYFPTSELYTDSVAGYESYTTVADRFARESTWDNFLTFHYTGETFDPDETVVSRPEPDEDIVAPGAGEDITIEPLTLEADVVDANEEVVISTDISGDQVAFIYFFAGAYDEDSNSIVIVDLDFIEGDNTKEVGGVYYPDWGTDRPILIDFVWLPAEVLIEDGGDGVLAMLNPESYGATAEEATYSVEGIYTFADGTERSALMFFNGTGQMTQVFGFMDGQSTGAPHEITPQRDETFTVLDEWIELDDEGYEVDFYFEESGTLTFGDQNFLAVDIPAEPGEYVVGILVEDFDGNFYEEYETIFVE